MPRKPRHYLPGIPAHVIQRGNNRQPCFFCEDDYRFYLECLGDASVRYGCAIHAYVLMTNHAHLLLTPLDGMSIPRVIQSVGRRYVRYINQSRQRTGTLWEGRHKGNVVSSERYVLACYRYIELNPVRAGMVTHPAEYPWSSYRYNACGETSEMLYSHGARDALGATAELRCAAYRGMFDIDMDDSVLKAIRDSAQYGVPLGNDRFRKAVECTLGRRVGRAGRGRPGKTNSAKILNK